MMRSSHVLTSILLLGLSGLCGQGARASGPATAETLDTLAANSLSANIVTLPTGQYVSAGDRQFRGLWTRDFCFASRGLFAIGRAEVVRSHLDRILSFTRDEDGLVPRYMDNVQVMDRYLHLLRGQNLPVAEPLQPNYSGGGGSQDLVIDSNSLVLLTAIEYLRRTGDVAWWNRNEATLVRVYRYHDRYLGRDGLIVQGRAADWQDSVKRTGRTFYTNLLYWAATERLVGFPAFGVTRERADQLKTAIVSAFQDPASGLYFSVSGFPQVSLDGLLLAIDLGFHPAESPEARDLYESLKRHPLWGAKRGGVPGYATYPDYPGQWIELMPWLTGMRHYHDRMYWSWLMGLSTKVAYLMGDRAEAERLRGRIEELAQRDGGISEVFDGPDLRPVRTYVYRSENPFSWGAGMILDALEARKRQQD